MFTRFRRSKADTLFPVGSASPVPGKTPPPGAWRYGQDLHIDEEKAGQPFHLFAGGAAFVEAKEFLRLLTVVPGVHQAVHSQVVIPHLVGLPVHPEVGQLDILVGGFSQFLFHQFPADNLGGFLVVPAVDFKDAAVL